MHWSRCLRASIVWRSVTQSIYECSLFRRDNSSANALINSRPTYRTFIVFPAFVSGDRNQHSMKQSGKLCHTQVATSPTETASSPASCSRLWAAMPRPPLSVQSLRCTIHRPPLLPAQCADLGPSLCGPPCDIVPPGDVDLLSIRQSRHIACKLYTDCCTRVFQKDLPSQAIASFAAQRVAQIER